MMNEHPKIKFGKTGVLIVNLGTPDSTKWSERDAVLICYPDQIADGDRAPLAVLENILQEMGQVFSTIHILPFYPSSSDRGFAVIDHRVVDHRFGSWANISSISSTHQVMAIWYSITSVPHIVGSKNSERTSNQGEVV